MGQKAIFDFDLQSNSQVSQRLLIQQFSAGSHLPESIIHASPSVRALAEPVLLRCQEPPPYGRFLDSPITQDDESSDWDYEVAD